MATILQFPAPDKDFSAKENDVLTKFFAAFNHCALDAMRRKMSQTPVNPVESLLKTIMKCIVMAEMPDIHDLDEDRVFALIA